MGYTNGWNLGGDAGEWRRVGREGKRRTALGISPDESVVLDRDTGYCKEGDGVLWQSGFCGPVLGRKGILDIEGGLVHDTASICQRKGQSN